MTIEDPIEIVVDAFNQVAVQNKIGVGFAEALRHVLRQGFAMILPGLFTGLLGAIWLSRFLSSLLYEVPVRDPLTFATCQRFASEDYASLQ